MSKIKERLTSLAVSQTANWPGRSIPASGPSAEAPGYLFDVGEVPQEVRSIALHRFGADLHMSAPRLNAPGYRDAGTYKGEVFNTEDYLIQEVAPHTVVFHRKEKLVFFSDRLHWADDHERLNGVDVQVAYDGDRPEVYPWNRARDRLTGVVASLKKSAKEMGMTDLAIHDGVLDQLAQRTWERIRQNRRAAGTSRQSSSIEADRNVVR